MKKVKLKDLMVGEDFKYLNNDRLFCYLGLADDGDATYVSIDYIGPGAIGNNVFSDKPDTEVIYIPRSFQNK